MQKKNQTRLTEEVNKKIISPTHCAVKVDCSASLVQHIGIA
jgi:hypothetical protein